MGFLGFAAAADVCDEVFVFGQRMAWQKLRNHIKHCLLPAGSPRAYFENQEVVNENETIH